CLPSSSLFVALALPPRHPPSFPTRRSSDLLPIWKKQNCPNTSQFNCMQKNHFHVCTQASTFGIPVFMEGRRLQPTRRWLTEVSRSEEHTSELQSRFDLVCRLLLEKKKAQTN